jgi:hypothetical protein
MAVLEDHLEEACCREGLFVRALGRPISANPYEAGTFENRQWERGWRSIDALPLQTAAAIDDEEYRPHAINLRYYLGASIAMVCLAFVCVIGLALVIFKW